MNRTLLRRPRKKKPEAPEGPGTRPDARKEAGGKRSDVARELTGHRPPPLHSGSNIVPRDSIAGQALLTVIAIMAFLACLTLGAVSMVRDTARGWQSDIAREVTVQVRPLEGVDLDKAVRDASRLLLTFDGVSKVTVLNQSATARLLEPWLGSGLQLDELPIPRLMTVTVEPDARPDFAMIGERLASEVRGASLDDHRSWVDRLAAMARTMVFGGIVIFLLVLGATVLTVVFATRGAMASNREIVDVLHFVGADRNFIAREFEYHFLRLGLKGAGAGGLAAVLVFLGLGLWSLGMRSTPEADQATALFGTFSLGIWGYLGIVIVAVLVAVLSGLTSRITVMTHVDQLETYGGRQTRSSRW